MTATDHDRDLEHLLRDDGGEWGALYRKLSRVEPPRRLDRNVLGEAPPPAPAAPARSPEPFPKAEVAKAAPRQKPAAAPAAPVRGAAVSPAASVPPAAPPESVAPALEAVIVGADATIERGAAAAAALTTTPRDQSGASTATQLLRSAELRNDMRLAPADWIRRIRWLLEQGRREQAVESLQLLRRVHPDLALPADLQALQ